MNIAAVDYYIPDSLIDISSFIDSVNENALPASFPTKEKFLDYASNTLGLKSVSVSPHTSKELIQQAFKYFLAKNQLMPDNVDLLIQAKEIKSQNDDLALFIKHECKFQKADVMNMSGSQCANIESIIDMFRNQFPGKYENILVYSYNHHPDPESRIIGNYAIEGDAVGMLLLTNAPSDIAVTDTHKQINGNLHSADMTTDYSLLHCKMYLETLKNFAARNNGLTTDGIGKIIIQKGNSELLEQCLASRKFDKKTFYRSPVLQTAGHLDCIDFVVSMKGLLDEGYRGDVLSYGIGWKGVYIISSYKFN